MTFEEDLFSTNSPEYLARQRDFSGLYGHGGLYGSPLIYSHQSGAATAFTATINPVTVINPLKGQFTDYLTDLEGSKCETLDDFDWNFMPFKWRNKSNGVDIDQFKADCEEIDND